MVKEITQPDKELIGNPDGKIQYTAEESKVLRSMILKKASQQSPQQKRQNELMGVLAEMTVFLDSPGYNQILEPGHFIKKILGIYGVPQQKLADYLGLNKSNFSALMTGSRKLNFDLALKLAHIFGIGAELWLQIQNKNELHRLRQANRDEYEKYSLKGLMEQ